MTEPTQVVVFADCHINSTVALCPPTIQLDDGGTYHASRGQRWLWDCWIDFINQVAALPGRKILISNGDLGELDIKKRTVQLITLNKATILRMVIDTLSPMLDIAGMIIVIRGTPAHSGKNAWLEEAVAQDIDCTYRYTDSIASFWNFIGGISGVKFDVAHHASMSAQPRLAPNAANRLAFDALYHYKVELNVPAPDIVIRSHNHRYATSDDNYQTHAILTRAWSLLPEYLYRSGGELRISDIGGLSIECDNGSYIPHNYSYKPESNRRVWKINL